MMSSKKSQVEKTVRVQFDLWQKEIDGIDALVVSQGSSSRAELIRDSLKYYAYHLRMTQRGYSLVYEKNDDPTQREKVVFL